MKRRLVYLDTSALTKFFRVERESEELQRFLGFEPSLASSLIARVELLRALRRTETQGAEFARARPILDQINFRRLTDEILARAAEMTPRSLRTLDALHLATALDLSPPPDLFLCYDRRLADAARDHGLAVVAPGADEVHEP